MSDHYRTLEIDKNASESLIKAAYRRLAKKYHPDKNKSENAQRIFQEINEAYEVLSDPEKRAEYDRRSLSPQNTEAPRQRTAQSQNPPGYAKSIMRKGKIFGLILFLQIIIIPLLLIRYSSKYNYEKGLSSYERGDHSEALIYFDRAIMEFGARKEEACFKAIDICYINGYIRQGIVFAQKGKNYISGKILKGNLCYLEGLGWEMLEQFDQADLSYTQALDNGYEADSVYIHLAMMHGFELDQYDKALAYFDHLIDISGLNEYKLQRGIIYQKYGKIQEAIIDLRNYINDYPETGMGYFFLGISLIESGQKEEACKIFQMATEKGMKESDAYLRLYCRN